MPVCDIYRVAISPETRSKSKMRPPTASSDGGESHRWRKTAGRPRDAAVLAVSVFPTPVGPSSRNAPLGLCASLKPARALRTAPAIASVACFWPTTLLARRDARSRSLCPSSRDSRDTGMPVLRATTSATSAAETTSVAPYVLDAFCALRTASNLLRCNNESWRFISFTSSYRERRSCVAMSRSTSSISKFIALRSS